MTHTTTSPLIVPSTEEGKGLLQTVLASYARASDVPAPRIVDGIHWGFRTAHSSLEAFVVKVSRNEWQSITEWHNATVDMDALTSVRIFTDTAPIKVSSSTPDGRVHLAPEDIQSEWMLVVSSPVLEAHAAAQWVATFLDARTPELV